MLTLYKANPYHDELGRFTTAENAYFVSVGGAFKRPTGSGLRALSDEDTYLELKSLNHKLVSDTYLDYGTYEGLSELAKNIHYVSGGRFSPKSVVEALVGDVESIKSLTISVNRPYSVGDDYLISVDIYGKVHGSSKDAAMVRYFDFNKNTVIHDSLELDKSDTGSGITKKMFKACIPEYEKMGMKEVQLDANLDVGGYAWAKYGFEAMYPLKSNKVFEYNFNSVVRRSETAFPLDSNSIQAIQYEASAVREMMETYHEDPKLVQLIADMQTPATDRALSQVYGVKTTSSKAILLGSYWEGTLKLDDPVARARLNKYIGA